MTANEQPRKPEWSPVVDRWLRLQAQPRVRWALRFGLRWVFVLVLVACVGLTVAYYRVFKDADALKGPTLRLQANDTVGWGQRGDEPLGEERLSGALDRALKRYREASGEDPGGVERERSCDWDNPYGPPVTVVVDRAATHGAFNSLLHTCVDAGFEQFVLQDASDPSRTFSFVLFKDVPLEGSPDWHGLPPLVIWLKATPDGRLASVKINQRHMKDLVAVRQWLVGLVGPGRGPSSIHAAGTLMMRCDPQLKIRHVLDACDAVTDKRTEDGEWVGLLKYARPACWGTGRWSDEQWWGEEVDEAATP